jgi:hypothetical protein
MLSKILHLEYNSGSAPSPTLSVRKLMNLAGYKHKLSI